MNALHDKAMDASTQPGATDAVQRRCGSDLAPGARRCSKLALQSEYWRAPSEKWGRPMADASGGQSERQSICTTIGTRNVPAASKKMVTRLVATAHRHVRLLAGFSSVNVPRV
jgi:hypothetical protein